MVQQASTQDGLLLGTVQGKSKLGSELFAGLRAELAPTPINTALSSFGGRMGSRVIMSLIRDKITVNYQKHRIDIVAAAVERAMPPGKEKVTLVDAPCSYSPLGITLALRHPHATVIEMDLPDIIQDKRNRLQRARDVVTPANLSFIPADFRKTPIDQVLAANGHPVIDVISFLSSSFSTDELVRLARYIRGFLSDRGAVMCFSPWKAAVQHEREANSLVRRQSQTEWKAVFEDKELPVQLFKEAGYSDVKVYHPSDLRHGLNITGDILDAELFIVARR